MLIEILYNKIQDKSKVLTSHRVQSIETSDSNVTVKTSDGQRFTGDIVVGGDGIHSKVREEMWKEARRVDPDWIDPSEQSGKTLFATLKKNDFVLTTTKPYLQLMLAFSEFPKATKVLRKAH